MNAVSKISAFPPTVQPGVPQLHSVPTGWSRGPIGQHLREVRRPVSMADAELYQLVTAKRARGGIVPREKLTGREISVKSQFRIEAGDFLISKRQIVHGACGLVPRELDGAIVSNEYGVLRARPSIDSRFLSYLSHSIYFQQTCFHSAIGVHIEKMIFKLDKWLEWEFVLPPLPEQEKIAEILSTWDKAIETTEKLLANAEAQKRALMQQLLTGKRRLKGFEASEWRAVTIGRMGKILSGGTPDSQIPEYWGGEIAWATPTDITRLRQRFIRGTERTITTSGLKNSSANVLPPGSLLVCTRATVGDLAIAEVEITTNQGFKNIVPSNAYDVEFLFYLLTFHKHELVRYACGSTFLELSKRDFEKRSFSVPDEKKEQTAIAEVLNSASNVVECHQRKIETLRSEKRALMQQLLTGKRRVTV